MPAKLILLRLLVVCSLVRNWWISGFSNAATITAYLTRYDEGFIFLSFFIFCFISVEELESSLDVG